MLRSVCRLWRDAIDGNPAYWTNIDDPFNEAHVALVMKNASVDNSLTVSGNLFSPRVFAAQLLLPSNHISELRLQIADNSSLVHIITAEFPRLRIVVLTSSARVIVHLRTWIPFHHSFHNIRSLTLRDIELPISSLAQLCALRFLTLSYNLMATVSLHPTNLTLAPFLAMLRLQPQLEYLRLTALFGVTSFDTAVERLILPSLSTLYLDATMSDAAGFLSSLRLPRIRHLDLALRDFGIFGIDDRVANIVFREAHDLTEIMGVSPSKLWTAPSRSIIVEHVECDAHLRLEFMPSSPADARQMAYIIRRIGSHNIRTLQLETSAHESPSLSLTRPPPAEPALHWAALLTLMPNITEIIVLGTGDAVDELPTALGDASHTGTLLCPLLECVIFRGGFLRASQCEAWILALGQRLDGGHILQTVSFSLWILPSDFWLDQFKERCVRFIAEKKEVSR